MKIVSLLITCASLLICTNRGAAQSPGSGYTQQTRSVIIYNTLTAGLTSGVGALINKKDKQKWYAAFLKGFIGGSIGGFVKYQGKNLVHQVSARENIAYNWPARLVYSAGESICENAAANQQLWSRWHVNLWIGRCELDFLDGKPRFSAKVSLIEPAFLVFEFIKGRRLDLDLTLKSGVFVFDSKGEIKVRRGRMTAAAYAWPGLFVMDFKMLDSFISPAVASKYKHDIFAHELTHTLQFNDHSAPIGTMMGLIEPAEWRHLPVLPNPSPFIQTFLYRIEGLKEGAQYYRNFFEFEAEYFATKRRVPIY